VKVTVELEVGEMKQHKYKGWVNQKRGEKGRNRRVRRKGSSIGGKEAHRKVDKGKPLKGKWSKKRYKSIED